MGQSCAPRVAPAPLAPVPVGALPNQGFAWVTGVEAPPREDLPQLVETTRALPAGTPGHGAPERCGCCRGGFPLPCRCGGSTRESCSVPGPQERPPTPCLLGGARLPAPESAGTSPGRVAGGVRLRSRRWRAMELHVQMT